MTYPRFIALVLLWEQDDQTAREHGQKLFPRSNTLIPMLKRLKRLGQVLWYSHGLSDYRRGARARGG